MKVEINNISREYTRTERVEPKKVMKLPEGHINKEANAKEISEKDAQKIRDTVDKMNKELENIDTSIKFKVHDSQEGGLNRVSIKVVERDSEKVIIEIPSEEAIEFSEKMDEITGMLFDHSR